MATRRIGALDRDETYRSAILQLTADIPGLCIDATCPRCHYPELSARVKWPEGEPYYPPILLCRKCGHVQRDRPEN